MGLCPNALLKHVSTHKSLPITFNAIAAEAPRFAWVHFFLTFPLGTSYYDGFRLKTVGGRGRARLRHTGVFWSMVLGSNLRAGKWERVGAGHEPFADVFDDLWEPVRFLVTFDLFIYSVLRRGKEGGWRVSFDDGRLARKERGLGQTGLALAPRRGDPVGASRWVFAVEPERKRT